MKKLFLGVVIGVLITTLLFCYFRPRPGPSEPVGVVYTDKIISGNISGHAQIKPQEAQEGGEENKTFNQSTDFKTSVPMAGNIETKHVKIEFTGVTEVQRTGDNLTVNTVFDKDVKETIYREPVKTWSIGLGVVVDKDGFCVGGHVQKDFPIWDNLVGYGRVEADRGIRIKAGMEYRF